jgi:3-methyladenine DNA glycosylase AlkD
VTRPPTAAAIERRLRKLGDPVRAAGVARFFKTGPGEYGAGDRFVGLTLPQIRRLVREYQGVPLAEARRLLSSPWHEVRLLALLILVGRYRQGTAAERNAIYRLYLRSTRRINNWDLVDCSAEHIVGPHLPRGRRGSLRRLATSSLVWERRIAILATFCYIKRGEYADTLAVARLLLADRHDLIHKATGWMLREVGKRDAAVLERFLRRYGPRMPRTAMRYAIERFPEPKRQAYLRIGRTRR